jgi:glycosyltransferase involved in cell wall biosynthesis
VTGRRIDLVFPRFKLLSGAERLILELAGALAARGHLPRIVCHHFDSTCQPLLAPGVQLAESGVRLDWFANRYLNAVFDYVRVGGLRPLLDPKAAGRVLYGPALRLLDPTADVAQVYHCFEPPRALYQDREAILDRSGLARWPLTVALNGYLRIDRALVARAPVITASGPFAAGRIGEIYGLPATPITHGLARRTLNAHRDLPREAARLVAVNYLHPRKRVDMIIDALALLPETTPAGRAVTLEIVGAGPESEDLRRRARERGVSSRVSFAGFVAEADLAAHYRRAGCYVHAAREESFGLSVIEAAYCELPVVAVAEGGVVDNVRDGETGVLTEATPESLAAGIRSVLWSPDCGRMMGKQGHAWVDARYTWDRGAEDLLGAIDRAL